jgi:hypothetical protein
MNEISAYLIAAVSAKIEDLEILICHFRYDGLVTKNIHATVSLKKKIVYCELT